MRSEFLSRVYPSKWKLIWRWWWRGNCNSKKTQSCEIPCNIRSCVKDSQREWLRLVLHTIKACIEWKQLKVNHHTWLWPNYIHTRYIIYLRLIKRLAASILTLLYFLLIQRHFESSELYPDIVHFVTRLVSQGGISYEAHALLQTSGHNPHTIPSFALKYILGHSGLCGWFRRIYILLTHTQTRFLLPTRHQIEILPQRRLSID